jgi:hypothetical protein
MVFHLARVDTLVPPNLHTIHDFILQVALAGSKTPVREVTMADLNMRC